MPTENATMFDQVAEVIERLRPFLLRDGGDCTLVDVEDGIVKLQLHGACGTCLAQQSQKPALNVRYTKKFQALLKLNKYSKRLTYMIYIKAPTRRVLKLYALVLC